MEEISYEKAVKAIKNDSRQKSCRSLTNSNSKEGKLLEWARFLERHHPAFLEKKIPESNLLKKLLEKQNGAENKDHNSISIKVHFQHELKELVRQLKDDLNEECSKKIPSDVRSIRSANDYSKFLDNILKKDKVPDNLYEIYEMEKASDYYHIYMENNADLWDRWKTCTE